MRRKKLKFLRIFLRGKKERRNDRFILLAFWSIKWPLANAALNGISQSIDYERKTRRPSFELHEKLVHLRSSHSFSQMTTRKNFQLIDTSEFPEQTTKGEKIGSSLKIKMAKERKQSVLRERSYSETARDYVMAQRNQTTVHFVSIRGRLEWRVLRCKRVRRRLIKDWLVKSSFFLIIAVHLKKTPD